MLKTVKMIDYYADAAFARPTRDTVIDTKDIRRIDTIDSSRTRNVSDKQVRIYLRNGSKIDVIGELADFVEPIKSISAVVTAIAVNEKEDEKEDKSMNQQDAERFVDIWQSSGSSAEAAKEMNMSPSTARSYASRLRKKGVPLKIMKHGTSDRSPIDVPALIRVANKYIVQID